MTRPSFTALRAAVIGTGFMGMAHVEALRRIGVPVAGIVGSTAEKSRRAAQILRLPDDFVSFEQVLADASVQSVHLAVPNRWHFAMARDALQAGKHVLCEKPLAMHTVESAELVALARKYPRQASGVNYNVRFYPLCIEAREMVRGGKLGDVFHLGGSYVQDWLLHDTDYNWRVLADQGGPLRAVADIGTHWLDLMYAITGLEIEAVCADLMTVHPTRLRPQGEVETFKGKTSAGTESPHPNPLPEGEGESGGPIPITTDDYGCILLRFKGGARGCLWVSQVTAGRKNCLRFEIAGSKQALAWNSERPDELWIGRRDQANLVLPRDPALVSPAAQAAISYPGGHNEGYADTFKQCFRAFYQYIEAGDDAVPPTFPTFADGHREIVLCEAVLRSHQQGAWVHIEGDGPSA